MWRHMTPDDVIMTIFLFALLGMVVEMCAKSQVNKIYESVKVNSLKKTCTKPMG